MLRNVSELINNEMNCNRRKMIRCVATNNYDKMYISMQYMKQSTLGMYVST